MDEDNRPAILGVLGGDGLWSVTASLRGAGAEVLDLEPAPKTVAEDVAARWHYGRASVRAGLLGHPRAALQLLTEGMPKGWIWKAGTLAVDGLRPEVDPEPMDRSLIEAYRLAHLAAVARLAGSLDRLILPLCRTRATVDAGGTVYGARPKGVTLPMGMKLTEVAFSVNEMRDDLQALAEHLRGINPGLVLHVTLQPSLSDAPCDLSGLTDIPGIHHDPVFDALLLSVARGGKGARLLAHLAQGRDIDSFGGASPAAVPEESEEDKRQRRKARRKAREAGRPVETKSAKVVCEDELLEAFRK